MLASIAITIDNGDRLTIRNDGDELEATVRQKGSDSEFRRFPPGLLGEVVSAFCSGVGIHPAGAAGCLAYLDYVRDMNECPVA
jgi:hypothetical protein